MSAIVRATVVVGILVGALAPADVVMCIRNPQTAMCGEETQSKCGCVAVPGKPPTGDCDGEQVTSNTTEYFSTPGPIKVKVSNSYCTQYRQFVDIYQTPECLQPGECAWGEWIPEGISVHLEVLGGGQCQLP